jgi:hypothetical protein
MIPTRKSKLKRLRIEGTSRTRKSNEKSPKKDMKSTRATRRKSSNHESFHTLGGQILFKMVKKIYAYGAEK